MTCYLRTLLALNNWAQDFVDLYMAINKKFKALKKGKVPKKKKKKKNIYAHVGNIQMHMHTSTHMHQHMCTHTLKKQINYKSCTCHRKK